MRFETFMRVNDIFYIFMQFLALVAIMSYIMSASIYEYNRADSDHTVCQYMCIRNYAKFSFEKIDL